MYFFCFFFLRSHSALMLFSSVESRRRREDDVMMPMMGEGMNPDAGPRPGMINKRHFPPGNVILRADCLSKKSRIGSKDGSKVKHVNHGHVHTLFNRRFLLQSKNDIQKIFVQFIEGL